VCGARARTSTGGGSRAERNRTIGRTENGYFSCATAKLNLGCRICWPRPNPLERSPFGQIGAKSFEQHLHRHIHTHAHLRGGVVTHTTHTRNATHARNARNARTQCTHATHAMHTRNARLVEVCLGRVGASRGKFCCLTHHL
jgi:hypothetical protein